MGILRVAPAARAWRGLGVMAALVSGAAGGGGEGGASGDDDDLEELGGVCTRFSEKVRQCGLLSGGDLDCSEETLGGAPGGRPDNIDESLCLLDCLDAASCAFLEAAFCGSASSEGVDPSG